MSQIRKKVYSFTEVDLPVLIERNIISMENLSSCCNIVTKHGKDEYEIHPEDRDLVRQRSRVQIPVKANFHSQGVQKE